MAGAAEGAGAKAGGDGARETIAPQNKRRLQKTRTGRRKFGDKRRAAFLEHLAATCNVQASAESAEVAISTVYATRMRDAVFRAGWQDALEQGYARLEAELVALAEAALRRPVRGDKESGAAPDPEIAMQLLRQHRRGLDGQPAGGRPAAPRDIEQVRARLEAKMRALAMIPPDAD